MNVPAWVILGALTGWVASVLTASPRDAPAYIVVGVVGASSGGLVVVLTAGTGLGGLNSWSMSLAVVGAVTFIAVARGIRQRVRPSGDHSRGSNKGIDARGSGLEN